MARRQPNNSRSVAEQFALVEDKRLEKYSTGCQPVTWHCSKIVPDAKSDVSAKTR